MTEENYYQWPGWSAFKKERGYTFDHRYNGYNIFYSTSLEKYMCRVYASDGSGKYAIFEETVLLRLTKGIDDLDLNWLLRSILNPDRKSTPPSQLFPLKDQSDEKDDAQKEENHTR